MPTHQELITAYRHLLRHGLRAVQFSKPARYVVRDRLRNSFRSSDIDQYDATKLKRTLEFLDGAADSRGIEHKLVKNLCHVWWERAKLAKMNPFIKEVKPFKEMAYEEFDWAIENLNETMGLCIK